MILSRSKTVLVVSSLIVLTWSSIYANVGIDSSFRNWDWALQGLIVIGGLLGLSSKKE